MLSSAFQWVAHCNNERESQSLKQSLDPLRSRRKGVHTNFQQIEVRRLEFRGLSKPGCCVNYADNV
jgi:hypothetical protein